MASNENKDQQRIEFQQSSSRCTPIRACKRVTRLHPGQQLELERRTVQTCPPPDGSSVVHGAPAGRCKPISACKRARQQPVLTSDTSLQLEIPNLLHADRISPRNLESLQVGGFGRSINENVPAEDGLCNSAMPEINNLPPWGAPGPRMGTLGNPTRPTSI